MRESTRSWSARGWAAEASRRRLCFVVAGAFSPAAALLAAALPGSVLAQPGWPACGLAVGGASGDQLKPIAASDAAGGAYVVWADLRSGQSRVYLQRVTGEGQIAPGWTPNGIPATSLAAPQFNPRAIEDGAGGVIMAWTDARIRDASVALQRITPSGSFAKGSWSSHGVFLYNDQAHSQPALCSDGAQGAIVAWTDNRRGFPAVYALRVLSDGRYASGWPPLVDSLGVPASSSTGAQVAPSLCPDGASGVFIAWEDHRAGNPDVYLQHLTSAGQRAPGWPAHGVPVATGPGLQRAQMALPDGGGGAIVVWADDGSGQVALRAQRFTAGGTPVWGTPGEGIEVSAGPVEQFDAAVAADGTGALLAAWQQVGDDETDVLAQRIEANGAVSPGWPGGGLPLCTAPGDQTLVALTATSQGGGVAAWTDDRNLPFTGQDIYVQGFTAFGSIPAGWPADGFPICEQDDPQSTVAITTLASDAAVVAWADSRGVDLDVHAARVEPPAPTGVLASLVHARARPGGGEIVWQTALSPGEPATLRRSDDGSSWATVERLVADGEGRVTYVGSDLEAGRRYGFRLYVVSEGREILADEQWLDVPGRASTRLAGFQPQPARDEAVVAFTLAGRGSAVLELFDAAGRRVEWREVGSLGAGAHRLRLGAGAQLKPGLYFVRLREGGAMFTVRAVVVGR